MSRVTIDGVTLTLTATDEPLHDAEHGARLYYVSAGDLDLGYVERVILESWRKGGRLRTSMRGYSRHWRARTTNQIAEKIADEEDRRGMLLPRGLVAGWHGGPVRLSRYGGQDCQTRQQALELMVGAARAAGLIK